jgi:hypothetical protein
MRLGCDHSDGTIAVHFADSSDGGSGSNSSPNDKIPISNRHSLSPRAQEWSSRWRRHLFCFLILLAMWTYDGTTTDRLLDSDRACHPEREVRRPVVAVHVQLQRSERDDGRLLQRGQARQGERDQSIRHVARELPPYRLGCYRSAVAVGGENESTATSMERRYGY